MLLHHVVHHIIRRPREGLPILPSLDSESSERAGIDRWLVGRDTTRRQRGGHERWECSLHGKGRVVLTLDIACISIAKGVEWCT